MVTNPYAQTESDVSGIEPSADSGFAFRYTTVALGCLLLLPYGFLAIAGVYEFLTLPPGRPGGNAYEFLLWAAVGVVYCGITIAMMIACAKSHPSKVSLLLLSPSLFVVWLVAVTLM